MDMPPLIVNGELTPEAAFRLCAILGAWQSFRESHDLESENLKCCEKSLNLFDALRAYEKLMMGGKAA